MDLTLFAEPAPAATELMAQYGFDPARPVWNAGAQPFGIAELLAAMLDSDGPVPAPLCLEWRSEGDVRVGHWWIVPSTVRQVRTDETYCGWLVECDALVHDPRIRRGLRLWLGPGVPGSSRGEVIEEICLVQVV